MCGKKLKTFLRYSFPVESDFLGNKSGKCLDIIVIINWEIVILIETPFEGIISRSGSNL